MRIEIERRYKCNGYTIGRLAIDSKYFCETLEDTDRGLRDDMSLDQIRSLKLKSITAIPTGTYRITLDLKSPKFGGKKFYKQTCNGKLPRLLDVKGFDGVLIHCGNTAKDTDGCVLIGENKVKGQVINSQETFRKFYPLLLAAKKRGEEITVTIT